MIETPVIKADHFDKFMCTMNLCKENCCDINWNIGVDEETYKMYENLPDDIKEKIYDSIKVVSNNPFGAVITKDDKGKCKLINDAGLCIIHAEIGEEYLCNTCRFYPRRPVKVADEIEVYLELSCEAAADLILFNEEKITLEPGTITSHRKLPIRRTLAASSYCNAADPNIVFHLLRSLSLYIIQSRQYNIHLRLLILGLLIKQAADLVKSCPSGNYSQIEHLVKTMFEKIESGYYLDFSSKAMDTLEPNMDLVLGFFKEIEKSENVINRCSEQVSKGFNIDFHEKLPEGFHKKYNEGYITYLSDKEYILENYIVTAVLSDGFPFNFRYRDSIMKNYTDLLFKFNLIKFMLVGIYLNNKGFDRWKTAECVSYLSRTYDHSVKGVLDME